MTAERLRPGVDEGNAGPLLAYGESRLYYVWDGSWDAAVMPLGLIDKIVALYLFNGLCTGLSRGC